MASTDNWADFDLIRACIRSNTVDKLKQILRGFNDECGTHYSMSGRKQDIIDRITTKLDDWKAANALDLWNKARAIVYQVRNTGSYTPTGLHRLSSSMSLASGSSTVVKSAPYNIPSSVPHFPAPYTAQRRPAPVASSSSLSKTSRTEIKFKESPFYRLDQILSAVVECPESPSATDRRQQSVSFTLSAEHTGKLTGSSPKYELRLFCTSSTFYSPIPSFRPNPGPCLIEFPPTCDVRVNGVQLSANLKGLKKKPGTAPPPNVGKHIKTGLNSIEMIYVNSQQPVLSKKFYLVVMLVEATSVDTLVRKLKGSAYKSREEVHQKIKAAASEDDDIVAGPQKMSLKCPLSFMRVNTPCRSSKCVHPQCFDATSWYSVMEQTTTWLCPVCERVLDPADLIIDGYFDSILKETNDTVDDVMVEADGEWHTADNKFASNAWKALHPTIPKSSAQPKPAPTVHSPPKSAVVDPDVKPKQTNVEILVLDDSDDEERVKRELTPSYASTSSLSRPSTTNGVSQTSSQADDVIDLTLDSDDDDDFPPPQPSTKRKADDAGLTSTSNTNWKKGRVELPPLASISNNAGSEYLPSLSRNAAARSPLLLHRAASSTLPFPGGTLPPVYSNGSYPGRSDTRTTQVPSNSRANGTFSGWR